MEALERFRRLFGVEAEVELVERGPDRIVVRFSGHMCFTCGAYDYFEDLAQLLSDELGEEWGVEWYEQLDDGTYLVAYRPAKLIGAKRRHVKVVIYGEEEDRFIG